MSWRGRALISQSGMRDAVTLARGVALPDLTGDVMVDGQVQAIIAVAWIMTVGMLLLHGRSLLALFKVLKVTATDEPAVDRREIATGQQWRGACVPRGTAEAMCAGLRAGRRSTAYRAGCWGSSAVRIRATARSTTRGRIPWCCA